MVNITKNLSDELNKLKTVSTNEGNDIPIISTDKVMEIAKKFALSALKVEIAALQQKIMPARYERNYDSISFPEQICLLNSTVAVVGCGGLGGNIIEMLARLGIGNLTVIDGDIFNDSNLNRQLLCTANSIGKGKAEIAAARIKQINSSINTIYYSHFVNSENIDGFLQGSDIVVDALDNIPARLGLQKSCNRLKIPLIHGAINNFYGQVSTILPNDRGLELIYGSSENYAVANKNRRVSVPSFTPAMVASFQVAEVTKLLLKRGELLRNKLLLINLETMDINVLEIN
jgi:molybdopterin/thiamine biosynthesis adenylyltransferase